MWCANSWAYTAWGATSSKPTASYPARIPSPITILSGMGRTSVENAKALKLKSGWLPPFSVSDSATASATSDAKNAASAGGTPKTNDEYTAATRSSSSSMVPCMPSSWMSSEKMSQKRFTSRSVFNMMRVYSPLYPKYCGVSSVWNRRAS